MNSILDICALPKKDFVAALNVIEPRNFNDRFDIPIENFGLEVATRAFEFLAKNGEAEKLEILSLKFAFCAQSLVEIALENKQENVLNFLEDYCARQGLSFA